MDNILPIGLIFFGTFISSLAQVMLKKSAIKKYSSVVQYYCNLKIFFAYFIFFIATLLTLYAYRFVPLSLAVLIESSAYVYILFLGKLFFDEEINRRKILGVFFIISGICICVV